MAGCERYVAGVDLGGTKIRTALADLSGRVLAEVTVPTEASGGMRHVVERILSTLERVQREAGVDGRRVAALGVGVPGPLDPESGVVYTAPNLGWQNVPVKSILEEKTGVPVYLENDADLAALGEHAFGAGRGTENMVYVTVSTGIGGGLILNGRLYRGSYGGAGEIGHTVVLPGGPPCRCGKRGCLEALASGTAIAQRAVGLVESGAGRGILDAAGGRPEGVTAGAVAAAAAAGDVEALFLMREAARYLGLGLANVITLLSPSLVVLGGGVMGAGEFFYDEICRQVYTAVVGPAAKARIVPAALGGRAGVLGAVHLALAAEEERINRRQG